VLAGITGLVLGRNVFKKKKNKKIKIITNSRVFINAAIGITGLWAETCLGRKKNRKKKLLPIA